ncbi:unnamed protein product [Owenia fusiformis]|uniref:Sushi domain-containing protein n=1 Tax=Owenia fusiformis TaxID=6347 RepID=A0A8S4Q5P4_OWEFU|nr:unnamed protein product [Owenia fusiformis]
MIKDTQFQLIVILLSCSVPLAVEIISWPHLAKGKTGELPIVGKCIDCNNIAKERSRVGLKIKPTCIIVKEKGCKNLKPQKNLLVARGSLKDNKPGDFVVFECEQGYKLKGKPRMECTRRRKWSPKKLPKCKKIPRPKVKFNTNTTREPGPVCMWSDWTPWRQSPCSVTCGNGNVTKIRNRSEMYGFSETGSPECIGDAFQIRHVLCSCDRPCKACIWSDWTTWTQTYCSATCGGGTQTKTRVRTRTKLYGVSTNGQPECYGESIERIDTPCCIDDPECAWGPWTEWMEYETCETYGLSQYPNCDLPGMQPETRNRSCICNGDIQVGNTRTQRCIGPSLERRLQECCISLTSPQVVTSTPSTTQPLTTVPSKKVFRKRKMMENN